MPLQVGTVLCKFVSEVSFEAVDVVLGVVGCVSALEMQQTRDNNTVQVGASMQTFAEVRRRLHLLGLECTFCTVAYANKACKVGQTPPPRPPPGTLRILAVVCEPNNPTDKRLLKLKPKGAS